MKKSTSRTKDTLKYKAPKNEANMAKVVAEQNLKPVLKHWVTEVFEPDPTNKDYNDALSFVEDILKNVQKQPNYLKLLSELALLMEKSKFAGKLLPFIFKTLIHPRGSSKNKIHNVNTLEFDHNLIMGELEDAAKELRRLKKAKKL